MDLNLLNRTDAKILQTIRDIIIFHCCSVRLLSAQTSGLHINQLLRNIQALHVTSRCQGLFPPHPFSKGKALGTRLVTLMLKQLGWDTLEQGRLSYQLSMFYKIQQVLVGISLPSEVYSLTRASRAPNTFPLRHIQSSCNVYKYSFYPSSIEY